MASGLTGRTNRPDTWPHPTNAAVTSESSCQGAVHTWHIADTNLRARSALLRSLSEVKRTSRVHAVMSAFDPKRTSSRWWCA